MGDNKQSDKDEKTLPLINFQFLIRRKDDVEQVKPIKCQDQNIEEEAEEASKENIDSNNNNMNHSVHEELKPSNISSSLSSWDTLKEDVHTIHLLRTIDCNEIGHAKPNEVECHGTGNKLGNDVKMPLFWEKAEDIIYKVNKILPLTKCQRIYCLKCKLESHGHSRIFDNDGGLCYGTIVLWDLPEKLLNFSLEPDMWANYILDEVIGADYKKSVIGIKFGNDTTILIEFKNFVEGDFSLMTRKAEDGFGGYGYININTPQKAKILRVICGSRDWFLSQHKKAMNVGVKEDEKSGSNAGMDAIECKRRKLA